MRYLRRSLLLRLSCLLLSACGFKPSGYYDVPEALQLLEIVVSQDRPSAIRQPLINLLKVNGVDLASSSGLKLEILEERMRKRTLTLTLSADTAEYELIGTVRFRVLRQNGEALTNDREAQVERSYYDLNNTTARDALEAQLRREMQQQLAKQIVRQYLSLNP